MLVVLVVLVQNSYVRVDRSIWRRVVWRLIVCTTRTSVFQREFSRFGARLSDNHHSGSSPLIPLPREANFVAFSLKNKDILAVEKAGVGGSWS